jgi:ankyrin repeat protein
MIVREQIENILRPKSDLDIKRELDKLDPNEILRLGVTKNITWIVKYALERGADPSFDNSISLYYSCSNRNIEVVKILLKDKRVDVNGINGASLRWAASKGFNDIVILLLKSGADASLEKYEAFRRAAQNGHLEMVKILEPYSDITAMNNNAIRVAAAKGDYKVVEYLYPKVKDTLGDKYIKWFETLFTFTNKK